MGKPFEISVDCGTGIVVPFTITEDQIRSHASIQVRAAIQSHGPDDSKERTRLLRGALEMMRAMIERNENLPLRVFDGADVWIIPDHAVRVIRLHDPEAPTGKKARVGFGPFESPAVT